MFNKSDIIKAWAVLRESTKAQSIPSETLDFMKEVSLRELEKIEKYGDAMSLEEIIRENGWYVADSFGKGVCIDVSSGEVKILSFKDKDDMKPTKEYLTLYKGLFDKKFKKVYSRQQLFGLRLER